MMKKRQQLHYTRLWGGGDRAKHRPQAQARKTDGVSSLRVGRGRTPPADAHSNAIAKQGRHAQSEQRNDRRAPSSAGPSRNPTPSSVPPRSHSSLGFYRETLREAPMPHPQGFDLQGYIKQHGSANDIQIGINGRCSPDEYFERYLDQCAEISQCEKRLPSSTSQCEKRLASSTSSANDMEELYLTERVPSQNATHLQSQTAAPRPKFQLVPLCWEDQLKKAEPDKILPKSDKGRTLLISYKYSSSSARSLSSRHLQDISVSIKWCNRFLLPETMLRQLKPPQALNSRSPPKQRVCMIPRADVAEGGEDGEGKEGNWGVEEGHRTNSLSSYELQRVSNDWGSMSDLEADHVSLSMDGATNGKCTTELPEPSSIPAKCINIHFHCSDPDTLKVLNGCSFEVTLLSIGAKSASAAPKPLPQASGSTSFKLAVLSDTESVISVAERVKLPKGLARLTVTCCTPRLLMLSTVLDMDSASSVLATPAELGSKDQHSIERRHQDGKGGSNDPPTERADSGGHMCGHSSERCCQDGEEDDDVTSLDVLAELLPDLELMNMDWPITTPPPPPPHHSFTSTSHVHRTYLNNLDNKQRGNSLPSGRYKYLFATTDRADNEGVLTPFRSSKGRRNGERREPFQQEEGKPCLAQI